MAKGRPVAPVGELALLSEAQTLYPQARRLGLLLGRREALLVASVGLVGVGLGVALFEQDLVEYLRITLRLESYFIEDGRKTFFLESLPYEAIRSGIILRAWESTPALICGTRSVSLCICCLATLEDA